MASYSVTTNTPREAELDLYLPEVNAARAATIPPQSAITKAQLVQGILNQDIDALIQARNIRNTPDAETIRQAYINATPTQQAAARAAIGL